MPWFLILKSPWTWVAVAFAALASYAAVQHIGWVTTKAEYAQFKADTERLAAASKVAAAREEARRAANATEVLSDLQTRLDRANARYASLRASSGSSGLPALSSAATSIGACPSGQPDAAARLLGEVESRITAILETGDREIAKYRELWDLQQRNAQVP